MQLFNVNSWKGKVCQDIRKDRTDDKIKYLK